MNRKTIVWLCACIATLAAIIGYWFLEHDKINDLIQLIQQERESDIVIGNPDAKNNIIVFFDYNCTYCRKFMSETYPEIENTFLKKHDIKLCLRLVCSPTDALATKAWQTAICLNKTGDFIKLHKLLMHKPEIIYTQHFADLTDTFISTNNIFEECFVTSDNQDIKRNIYQFQQLQTKGTPTFVIGQKVVKGYKNAANFKQIIESALD